MQSTNGFPEPPVSPLVPIEELGRSLLGATLECAFGFALGALVARAARERQMHWTWPGALMLPVLLAGAGLGGWTGTLTLTSLSACFIGRRRHREDLTTGADLARRAARRRGPISVLSSLVARAELRRREAAGPNGWRSGGDVIVGTDERGSAITVPFGGAGGGTHTLVVGATGSGKTVTQTWLAVRAIEAGSGAIVVDPKGDRGMREELRRAARAAGRRFIEWSPEGPSVFNPYARGGETEIADKALAGERFTEPHYQRQAQRYLGHVVRALRENGLDVSLRGIVENLDPDRLETLARSLPQPQAEASYAYLDSLTRRQRSELAGVRDRLAIVVESDVGPWLDPHTPAEQFDLLEASRARAVVYFDLQSDSRPLLTQILGAAIVQDLQTTVASLQGRPVPTVLVIDEFSAVAAEQVVRLFGRARSAGLSLVLGTQEVSDLRLPGRERLLEQVMGNLSVLIAHRQVVPASAELIASVAGSRGAWRVAQHSDGRTTRTRTRESILDADEVRRLRPGWAAVIVLGRQDGVRVGHMLSPRPAG